MLIVKENVTSSDELEIDREDSSVTRPIESLREIFANTGFKCIKEMQQLDMPQGLYPVYIFALLPCRS